MLYDEFGRDVRYPVIERQVLITRRLEHLQKHNIGIG